MSYIFINTIPLGLLQIHSNQEKFLLVWKFFLSRRTKPTEVSFASCFGQVFVDYTCDTQDAKKCVIVMRQKVSAVRYVCL